MTMKLRNNPYSNLFPDIAPVEAETQFKKLMIAEDLLLLLEEHGISRTELANRMGVSPSRVTSMLAGSNNFTVESLVRSGRALESDYHHCFAPIGKKVRWCFYDKAEDDVERCTKKLAEACPEIVDWIGLNQAKNHG